MWVSVLSWPGTALKICHPNEDGPSWSLFTKYLYCVVYYTSRGACGKKLFWGRKHIFLEPSFLPKTEGRIEVCTWTLRQRQHYQFTTELAYVTVPT